MWFFNYSKNPWSTINPLIFDRFEPWNCSLDEIQLSRDDRDNTACWQVLGLVQENFYFFLMLMKNSLDCGKIKKALRCYCINENYAIKGASRLSSKRFWPCWIDQTAGNRNIGVHWKERRFIYGIKSKPAPQSRGNRHCRYWKRSQTGTERSISWSWIINKVRFTDDTAIIAKTQEELQDMVNRLVNIGRK